jgi:flagellar basal-body rod modification protein FlgD
MSSTISNDIANVVAKTTSTTSAGATKTLGKEDFMKMLVAQLKNQNPLNPMDGTDFATQLAQFSSLEQLTNLNTQIKTQGVNQLTLGYAQSVNMIGKDVIAQNGNTVTVDGSSVDLNYQLADAASRINISIYDQDGRLVKTIEDGGKETGMNKTTWNCGDMPQGAYTFQVIGSRDDGSYTTANPLMSGKVTAVHFKNNAITLTVNGQELALGNVISVKQPENNL